MNERSSTLLLSVVATLALGLLAIPARAQATPDPHTLHLAAVTADGKLWHTIRYPNGAWQPFGDVKSKSSDPGFLVDVDIQVIGSGADNVLHVCAVSSAGRLWHAIRYPNAWTIFGDVQGQAGERGRFVSVAVANVNGDLHVCGVTDDGRLWHTIRHASGGWEPFTDVKAQACDPGPFTRVTASVYPNVVNGAVELYVCGVTSDGRLYHTVRHAEYWSPFTRFLLFYEGANFTDVDCAFGRTAISHPPAASLQVAGVLSNGNLWTSRHPLTQPVQPMLAPGGGFGPFLRASIGTSVDAAGLRTTQVAAVTPEGGLVHSLGPDPWTAFGNVKGVAGDPGRFVSVSVDAVSR